MCVYIYIYIFSQRYVILENGYQAKIGQWAEWFTSYLSEAICSEKNTNPDATSPGTMCTPMGNLGNWENVALFFVNSR